MGTITDRIREIIAREGLSQSAFADETGLNKSTLNHVLTERNQPSSSVMQKIVAAFPQYRLEWLMVGELPMFCEEYSAIEAEKLKRPLFPDSEVAISESSVCQTRSEPIAEEAPPTRTIDKIIVYYSDKTFEVFEPNK